MKKANKRKIVSEDISSKDKKLQDFKEVEIFHPKLEEIFESLWRAVLDPQSGSTVMVYGPAGVGKSTLSKYLIKRIFERFTEEIKTDNEHIPVVKVEAGNAVSGSFNWKQYFIEILKGLCEPAIEQKLDLNRWQSSQEDLQKTINNPRNSCATLRDVAENALLRRRPKAVIIDEAQHLCTTSSSYRLMNQPDSIKSIANRSKTTHVLFGSYGLLKLKNLNGQLARRTIPLHFSRYTNENEQDIENFKLIISHFQNALPLETQVNLISHFDYIYSRSAGCVGVLKEWFNRSLSRALAENSKVLEMSHFEATALDTSQARKLFQEAHQGQFDIEREEISQSQLQDEMSYEYFLREMEKESINNNMGKVSKGNNKIGRLPKRDRVGGTKKTA